MPCFRTLTGCAIHPWAISSATMDIACDVAITASMIYYLYRGRSQIPRRVRGSAPVTPYQFAANHGISRRTNRAVNMLITYALNTDAYSIFCCSQRTHAMVSF